MTIVFMKGIDNIITFCVEKESKLQIKRIGAMTEIDTVKVIGKNNNIFILKSVNGYLNTKDINDFISEIKIYVDD